MLNPVTHSDLVKDGFSEPSTVVKAGQLKVFCQVRFHPESDLAVLVVTDHCEEFVEPLLSSRRRRSHCGGCLLSSEVVLDKSADYAIECMGYSTKNKFQFFRKKKLKFNNKKYLKYK